MKKKITITLKEPKHRDINHFKAQVAGLLRTKVIRNKKKDQKKFNWKQGISYYSSILQNA